MFKEGKSITEYSYSDDTGDAQAVVYHLFPGVEVVYISVHMETLDFGLFEQGERNNYASIHFCREGRIEQEVNNEFFYLMPGDCSPLDALHHICGGMYHIVLRSSETAKKFFRELYEADYDQRLNYLRVKMPELFFRMKYSKTDSSYYDRDLVPRTQVEIVKAVSHYITKNLNEKITVKQLTLEFGISDTYLQNAFRNVYGMPVISFIRTQKMQSAAQVLIHTTRTIDEIAEEFGYENESKFSAAFKKIMGDSPGVYRKEHSKVKII